MDSRKMVENLIINSGIQYLSIPLDLSENQVRKVKMQFADEELHSEEGSSRYKLKEVFFWSDESIFIEKESINQEAYSRFGKLNEEDINRNYINEVEEDEVYSVSGMEVMDICVGYWIPLPYFRVRQEVEKPFHFGPEHWCRMNLQKQENEKLGTTHVLVLAFDTNAGEEDTGSYERPTLRDSQGGGNNRFKCVINKKHAPAYFTSETLWDWMYNVFEVDHDRSRRNKHKLKHVAIYYTLLKLLDECDAFPEIGLIDGKKDENPIEVGLTIDIGNSRTCGLLCEKSHPYGMNKFDFTSARKLQIRNLSTPHKVYEDPFEMQVAFAEEKFGNSAADMIDDVFEWPSLVRVGPEAIELTSYFETEDTQASMSSPKRYLWDKEAVRIPWIKVDSGIRLGFHEKLHIERNAIYGIALYVDNKGKLIREGAAEMGATESNYSRSSIMKFAIYEILLHAITQINSPEFRRDQGKSRYRRVLKDVVITCPTAMTVQEQYILRKSINDAVKLIYRTMQDKIDFCDLEIEVHPALPSLDIQEQNENPWKMDEGTCSQLAFLYGELVHKYAGNEKIFFDIYGKYRGGEDTKSVNIASIDIGEIGRAHV